MRYLFLLPFLIYTTASAQWSGDPSAPTVVCPSPYLRYDPHVVTDAEGNWYLFWLDLREDNYGRIYGQQLDPQGHPQWEPDGRLILEAPNTGLGSPIAVVRTAGDRILIAAPAFHSQGGGSVQDTLWVTQVDNAGTPTWPAIKAMTGHAEYVSTIHDVRALSLDGGDALLSWIYIVGGSGQKKIAVTRIAQNGDLAWGAEGVTLPNVQEAVGTIMEQRLLPDDADGAIICWSRQVAGSPVKTLRINADGASLWPEPVEITQGSSGTGLHVSAGSFQAMADGAGGVVAVWSTAPNSDSGDILMGRVNGDGQHTWSPAVKPVCMAANQQHRPRLDIAVGSILVSWDDRRTIPGSRPHAQRLTLDGDPVWPVDGISVNMEWANNAYPRIATLADGGAMVLASAQDGHYYAQRIAANGTLSWASPTIIATGSSAPFAGFDIVHHLDAAEGITTFWSRYDKLLAASTTAGGAPGTSVGIPSHEAAQPMQGWPVPASDHLWLRAHGPLASPAIKVFTADGRALQVAYIRELDDVLRLNVGDLAPGAYVVRIFDGVQAFASRFIKE